jgi:hypothetical protein
MIIKFTIHKKEIVDAKLLIMLAENIIKIGNNNLEAFLDFGKSFKANHL